MDNKVLLKEETVVSIADAIREKSGSSEKMTPAQMAVRIQNLTVGGSEDLIDDLNAIHGEEAKSTAGEAVTTIEENVDEQAGLISQIQTALEGKMGGSGGSGNMATVQFIDTGGLKSISYSDSDGVKYIDANFPSEINCSIPSILVIEALVDGMYPTERGDITALKSAIYDDDSSQYYNMLGTYIVNGNCSITVYAPGGG